MPIIGIITNNSLVNQEENLILPIDYVKVILASGGEPYLIPLIDDSDFIDQTLDKIDGLLIPGGKDIKLLATMEGATHDIDSKLDAFEIKLIHLARDRGIPILAICRGFQLLNFAYDGTLHKKLTRFDDYDSSIIHNQEDYDIPPQISVHDVLLKDNSKLSEMFGSLLKTNSTHHQAVNRLGDGLGAVGWTKDHLVEAVEGKDDDFLVGVQWHPETMGDEMKVLFDKFVEASATKKEKTTHKIVKMTKDYALEITNWKYESSYSIYNLDDDLESLTELLENEYYVLIENDELIGFYCANEAAQVPYGHNSNVYDDLDYIDIGLGLRPDLCGKGNGFPFIEKGLDFLQKKYKSNKFRLSVFDFNKRAINLYHKSGFIITNYFKSNKHHYFLVMTLER